MSTPQRPLQLQHLAIAASAGAGKTYQLVTRYIGLLIGGVRPSSIAALTFSRKAGGEIFSSLVNRLATAAQDDKQLQTLNQDLQKNGYLAASDKLTIGLVTTLLRSVIREMHQTRIGTLDSFFVSILRAFPFEYDLGGDFEIMSEYDTIRSREEVLGQLLRAHTSEQGSSRSASSQLSSLILRQHQLLSKGRDEIPVHVKLDKFTREMQTVYQSVPSQDIWGVKESIWPGGGLWERADPEQVQRAAQLLQEQIAHIEISESSHKYWREFCEEVPEFREGMKLSKRLDYILKRTLPKIEQIKKGDFEIKTGRESYQLYRAACDPLLVLVSHITAVILELELSGTQGLFTLLETFEQTYDRLVRRRGRLSFSDVLHLLSGGQDGEQQALRRLDLDYRLDASLDHWLLDEFQDTSLPQWRAIANLVDEVLQDNSGGRSLFYVGDVKQAIYNWRGGKASLFHDLLAYYNQEGAEGERIIQKQLSCSWRSAPPVIDAVNRVFGNLQQVQNIPEVTRRRWQSTWEEHTTTRITWSGSVQLHIMTGKTEAVRSRQVFSKTVSLLEELTPWKRGWSCALLVRTNKVGRALVEMLRSRQIPAVWEGALPVAESIFVQGILSLVKTAAHPGDSTGWEYLKMTPLAAVVAKEYDDSRGRTGLAVLKMIDQRGYAGMVSWWRDRLQKLQKLTTEEREQALALVEAALEYDQSGSGAPLDFIDFVWEYRKREPLPGSVIQVTTLHQAKGLQYDVVILPELHARTNSRNELLSGSRDDSQQELDWLLTTPQKVIVEGDPVLREQQERQQAEEWYERLCLLYVGMTRAIRGLYLITPERGKSAAVARLSTLLQDALAPGWQVSDEGDTLAWETGDRDWYLKQAEPDKPDETGVKMLPLELTSGGLRKRLERLTPSAQVKTEFDAALLFEPNYGKAADLGTALHALLERVSWLDECDTTEILENWQQTSSLPAEMKDDVTGQFRVVMERESSRELFSMSSPDAELWRERRFEIAGKGEWISGSFDRVILECDTNGEPQRATVIDFKSNNLDHPDYRAHLRHTYQPQLDLYRRVLSEMTGLDSSVIRTVLLLTRNGEVLEIQGE
jgi:ATP-dependent helicase/nuclease subunit A